MKPSSIMPAPVLRVAPTPRVLRQRVITPILLGCLVLAFVLGAPVQGAQDSIKVLTIGSSFAENATGFLPELAAAHGIEITVAKANLGGSDLARHARHLRACLADPESPEGRPYRDRADPLEREYSLVQILASDDWDFVTLQQFSGDSFKPETYEPYSSELVDAVRRFAPHARIVVHQTWAYRIDHPMFIRHPPEEQTAYEKILADRNRGAWENPVPLTQESMYQGLRHAYDLLAARYDLLMVPVGDAFQIARATPEWHFVHPDPDFDYANPPAGTRPNQEGSLIGGWFWRTDRNTGQSEFALDAKHANVAGKYLGACVFFEALTNQSALEVTWWPEPLTREQAVSLQRAAHHAVAARRL